jgi:Xaa-Pro aminopeptidase
MSFQWKPWQSAGVKPEYQPRRVFGTQAIDWQERINFERLRKERVAKLQDQMKKNDTSALLLYRGDNIRYATNTWNGTWRIGAFRYCMLPAKGDPLLFESVGCDLEADELYCPWLRGRLEPSISYQFNPGGAYQWGLNRQIEQIKSALGKEGIRISDKIGVDEMLFGPYEAFKKAGFTNLVAAQPIIVPARWIKTKDELEILKIAMCIGDAAFGLAREEWVRPGIKECELEAKIAEFMIAHNMEQGITICASGGNTNPYIRSWGDKMLRPGDMAVMDIIYSYLGYNTDYVRCFPVGHIWSWKQKELYKRAYDSLMSACESMKPGVNSAKVAEKFEHYADDVYGSDPVVNAAHSLGMGLYEGLWISRAFAKDHNFDLEEGMYFAVETYAGDPGGFDGARLERNGVITDKGFEPFDLFPFEEEAIK